MQTLLRRPLAWGCLVVLTLAAPLGAQVIPGDTDHDNELTITDAIRLLSWLNSRSDEDVCVHVADVNADGIFDLSDVVYIMNYMFNGGEEPRQSSTDPDECYGDNSPLRLSSFEVVPLSPVSAAVKWETLVSTSGQVEYGLYPWFMVYRELDGSVSRRHRTLIEGLRPDTEYYVQVVATADAGTRIESRIVSFRTQAEETLHVRPDHPRLLLSRDSLPEIFRRIASDPYVRDRYDSLMRWSGSELETPDSELFDRIQFPLYVRAFAFAALLSRDSALRGRAIELALAIAGGAAGDETRDAVESMAYVYDWLHGDLAPAERALLASAIVRGCADLDHATRDDEYVLGAHSIRNQRAIVFGCLAVHGEHPEAVELLQRSAHRFQYGFLPSLRYFATSDGGSVHGWWYSVYDLQWTLSVLAAWTSSTGVNWIEREKRWLEPMVSWFAHGLRADGTFIRLGDSRVFSGLVWQHRLAGLLLASHTGSTSGMWLAERAREAGNLWTPHAIYDILWHDSSIPARHPAGPTKKLFDEAGVAVFRSSWSPDATVASFRAEQVYALGHTHRDNCSFTLYHRGDLALDSGIYDEFGGEHHRNYYSRSVAHNTITVHDPDEEFTLYGVAYANDGGQRWLQPGEDVPSAWPASIEEAIRSENGYRAPGIVRFEVDDDLAYALADGTSFYSPEKLLKYHRHFVWLDELEGWGHPAIIVVDDVIASRAELRKSYLLHTQNRPRIEGSLLVAEEGDGVLYQQTVLPRFAEIELIGGPGREFWVDGKNYPPTVSPRENELPGNWRAEISPPVARRDEIFVHAIFPADAGSPQPPLATPLLTGDLIGVRLSDWTLLFSTDDPISGATYYNTRPESRQVIFGLQPLALHTVELRGETVTVRASEAGTLRFFARYAGWISIRRS